MQEKKSDLFSSKWAYIFAVLGMAIGAGNIWRFPRLAGQYGGSFLIPWIIFLFLWSLPLIIIEFSIGKNLRLGVIASFTKILGKGYAWMGWFVAMCTIGIMFYYSVVCGWSLKYFTLAISGTLTNLNHTAYWQNFTTGNFESLLYFLLTIIFGCFIIYQGIARGIEKATKIMVPLLFLLLIISAAHALTLPKADLGLKYFFKVNIKDLLNYKVWLEALSQSAWSTGAGWGLILTYSTYVKKRESIVSTSVLTGIGNNLASIIVGLAVIPTMFALSPTINAAKTALEAGNQGLTFIYIPQLFNTLTGGNIFATIFFLALFIASISSFLSMLELAVKLLLDYGYSRHKAIVLVGSITTIAGIPSALCLKFFNNQDWVWGIGLLLSGFFFTFLVFRLKIHVFIVNFLSEYLQILKNKIIFIKIFLYIMLSEFLAMLMWWFVQSVEWYPQKWWNPFEEFSLGTCIFQWFILIGIGIIFTKEITRFKIRKS